MSPRISLNESHNVSVELPVGKSATGLPPYWPVVLKQGKVLDMCNEESLQRLAEAVKGLFQAEQELI